jgi:hypothetical protein
VDWAGIFHGLPRLDDARLAQIFARPILALDRLLFLDREGKVGYRHGEIGGVCRRGSDNPSPDVDVRSREASARPKPLSRSP